eukprot:2345941-Pyramimonas_sp.AAC.2
MCPQRMCNPTPFTALQSLPVEKRAHVPSPEALLALVVPDAGHRRGLGPEHPQTFQVEHQELGAPLGDLEDPRGVAP